MGTHPIFESDFDCLTEVTNVAEKGNHCGGGCGQLGDFDLCYFGLNLKSNVFTRYWFCFNCHSTLLLGSNRYLTCNGPQRRRRGVGYLVHGLVNYGWWCFGPTNLLKELNLNYLLRSRCNLWYHYFNYYGLKHETLYRKRSRNSIQKLRGWLSRFWCWYYCRCFKFDLWYLCWNCRLLGRSSRCRQRKAFRQGTYH